MDHQSVLLDEVLHWLDLPRRRSIIDATVGLGGHSRAIFSNTEFSGTIIGIDQDESHLAFCQNALKVFSDRFRPEAINFAQLETFLDRHSIHFDGILFDLGVASPHYDIPDRGFSFQHAGPLDMRMDQRTKLTASIIVNTYPELELAEIFKDYGEERLSRQIARQIVSQRQQSPLQTTAELSELISAVYHRAGFRYSQKNPATRVFQALRIAVNAELDVLTKALQTSIERVDVGGRILVISYHSLEDRIVKHTFQHAANPCHCPPELPICACEKKPLLRILTKRPILPADQEIASNPRSRSAKLRVAERI